MLFLTPRFDAYRHANPLRYRDSGGSIISLNNTVTACQAEYILAIVGGVCQGVFVADERVPVDLNRVAFEGREAPRMIWDMYVGKTIADTDAQVRCGCTGALQLEDLTRRYGPCATSYNPLLIGGMIWIPSIKQEQTLDEQIECQLAAIDG